MGRQERKRMSCIKESDIEEEAEDSQTARIIQDARLR